MDAGAVMALYLKSRKTNPNVNQTQEQYTGRDQATSKWEQQELSKIHKQGTEQDQDPEYHNTKLIAQ